MVILGLYKNCKGSLPDKYLSCSGLVRAMEKHGAERSAWTKKNDEQAWMETSVALLIPKCLRHQMLVSTKF